MKDVIMALLQAIAFVGVLMVILGIGMSPVIAVIYTGNWYWIITYPVSLVMVLWLLNI